MNLLIAPIDKKGLKKVGIKVTAFTSEFVSVFNSFRFNSDEDPFGYFFHFCGELRSTLIGGLGYQNIELTDGYDVQDKNIYIDYAHNPPKIFIEDREGCPAILEIGKRILTYRKASGTPADPPSKYIIVKEIKRDEKYLECIVSKNDKEEFRKFKIENIISETEE